MIVIIVNGTPHTLTDSETVAALLDAMTVPARGVAVAVNGEVVRRGEWPGHRLADGDRVEVLTAAQGG